MKRVYKYPLRVNDRQIVKLPKCAEILSVQIQRGDICLWALIDTSVKETNDVAIRIHGTGHDIEYDGNLRFIGTVQMLLGDIVFHIFEEIKEQQQ